MVQVVLRCMMYVLLQGISGRIHISELQEPLQQPPAQDPLKRYSHDQMVLAAVMGHVHGVARSKSKDLELTLRPAAVAAAQKVRQRYCSCLHALLRQRVKCYFQSHLLMDVGDC